MPWRNCALAERSDATIEEEIRAFGAALDEALIANDAAAIAPFFGDEWIFIGPNGPTQKAHLVDWIATGKLAHHSMHSIGEPRIVVYGETVVASARRASTGLWEGVTYSADEWITEVYVRREGAWRCVISHKCPVG
jgi:ketosteroid isomerase-like protein